MSRHPDVPAAARKNPAAKSAKAVLVPKAHFGKTAKKPENDDRPLRHGPTQRRHKRAQIKAQQKI